MQALKRPKMILFDYGQTLADERTFNGVRGTEALLRYAVRNKYNLSAAEVQRHAEEINRELGRGDPSMRHGSQVEVPNHMFSAYLYASLGIELSLSYEEIDKVFWDAAAPAEPTEGIADFLRYLREKHIRTGVISNISFAASVVKSRIHTLFPEHEFEFILATSEYMFRKPNRRIFDLALEMADLPAWDVWYIGDNEMCDVDGARDAGLTPAWYVGAKNAPVKRREDVVTIRRWGELQDRLDAL